VSILESFADIDGHNPDANLRNVSGLARMVQVAPLTTVIDLTVSGVSPGTYRASVRQYGDLKRGALSTGPTWGATAQPGADEATAPGNIGLVEVGPDGRGELFVERPFAVWSIIGCSVLLAREGAPLANGVDTLVGVVARSAGVWDNDKQVCSCTGKTLWEERKEQVEKGMI
jgi:copper chaperone for superoxide dismutase